MQRREFMARMLATVAALFHAVARAEGETEGLHAKVTKVEDGKATLTLAIMPRETRFILEGYTGGLTEGEFVQFHLKDGYAVWGQWRLNITNVQFVP